jgi:uncharacterized protein YjiS (DUF1127 family)
MTRTTAARAAHTNRRHRLRQRAIHLGLAVPVEALDDVGATEAEVEAEAGVDPDTVSAEDVDAR